MSVVGDYLTFSDLDAARKTAQEDADINDSTIDITCNGVLIETVVPAYWNDPKLDPRWME